MSARTHEPSGLRLRVELVLMVLGTIVFVIAALFGALWMAALAIDPGAGVLGPASALVIVVGALAAALMLADPQPGHAVRRDRRSGRRPGGFTVTAHDGTPLHVEVDGPEDADVTVVFCHGWMSDLATWREQRAALDGTTLRRVFYDQRGHGHSGWHGMDDEETGVRQLADDLRAVIEAAAPTGSLYLVGHSMGGMTVIAFAGRHLDVMRQRVDGVLLCATTATPLADSFTLGLPEHFERTHRFIRRYAVSALGVLGLVPPRRKALDVGSRCLEALMRHDERGSLGGLDPTRVTVVVPGRDRLVPREEQLEIAALVGGARIVTAPHSGHMVTLDAPALVTAELLGLVVLSMDRPTDLLAG